MLCVCGCETRKEEFGSLVPNTVGGSSSFIAKAWCMVRRMSIGKGSISVLICPNCGTLKCDPEDLK